MWGGALPRYRAEPSALSTQRFHLVSLKCEPKYDWYRAAAVGVEPTNAWFRARCLRPLGDTAVANRTGIEPVFVD